MRYFGGKARISRSIAEVINKHIATDTRYIEPFCGSCNVAQYIQTPRKHLADNRQDIIRLWEALQKGWEPPSEVSEEEYQNYKTASPSAMRAFVGFGCSYGGKFFGGFARSAGRNYALNAKNSLSKKSRKMGIGSCVFTWSDYRDLQYPCGSVVYCDPPYEGTTQPYAEPFDSTAFWKWAEEVSQTCVVFVSEYAAPKDWEVVWSHTVTLDMRSVDGKDIQRIEKLFCKKIPQ